MKLRDIKDMMTPRQVAAATGIGVNAVYLLLKQRHIPSINVGHDMYITRPQYLRWLETVQGSFPGPASRNANGLHIRQATKAEFVKRILPKPTNGYWASMTPEQRSKEVRRRRVLGRKRKAKRTIK